MTLKEIANELEYDCHHEEMGRLEVCTRIETALRKIHNQALEKAAKLIETSGYYMASPQFFSEQIRALKDNETITVREVINAQKAIMRTKTIKLNGVDHLCVLVCGGPGFKLYSTNGTWVLVGKRKTIQATDGTPEYATIVQYALLKYQPVKRRGDITEKFKRLIA